MGGSVGGTGVNMSGQERVSNINPLVKKYYEKLGVIDDLASREKVRKEIERFS